MKNQFKKSLSLIMAVLMLLSCWVWVAPTEAEAAGGTTKYYVKYRVNVTDSWGNSADQSKIRIYYKPQNGKGTETYIQIDQAKDFWSDYTGTKDVWEGYIDGFPTKLTQYGKAGSSATFGYDSATLYVGSSADSCTTVCFSGGNFGVKSGNTNNYPTVGSTSSGIYPYIATLDNPEAIELTLGKLGSTTNATATGNVASGKDQYGISWEASFPTSGWTHKMAIDGSGTTTGLSTNNISVSGTSNKPTITAKPDTQKLKSNPSGGKVTYYLLSTYGSATATTQVIVSYPAYQATFYANGGQIGADKDNVSATGEVKVPASLDGAKTYYGAPIGKQPAYTYREGYDFDAFYTVDNDDATGLNASFSGTKFVDGETTVGTEGDSKWYAAWKAKKITATFVTQDGQLIGTVEGRYDNYLTNSNIHGATLNAKVKASHTAGKVKFNGNNEPIYTDGSTSYTFAGWKIIKAYDESVMGGDENTVLKGDVTFQATYTKADATRYTVSFEDGAGNVVSSKDDYLYRDLVTGVPSSATKAQDDKYTYEFIGWAKKLAGVNFFAVDENDCDADGIKLAYTSKDAAEFIVKGDAAYVPVFRMTAREYNVTFSYMVDGGTKATLTVPGYHWGDTITVPESIKNNYTANGFRYYIESWNGPATVNSAAPVLTAVYGEGDGAEYAINFYGKAEDGVTDVLLSEGTYVHGSTVTAPEVPQEINTEDSLYTFAGWSPEVNTTASGDVDYYATYTKQDYADIRFYNYDGTLIYETKGDKENGYFVGETIPAFDGETPIKAEDVIGTYTFTGWADSQGNTVVPGTDKFTGDTYLYAQFETTYKKYIVKFLNDDGTVVSEKEYKYGEEIEIPDDPTKAADVEYSYDFRAWSPEVSEVCYGDATYTATYRRTPQYYKVTWLKDNKTVHSESNYRYGTKIQQGVINNPVSYATPAEGKDWAFKHWVQCDANGNDILVDGKQVIFQRGMTMGAEHLYFYPVFEEVDNILTVKFFKEDGTTLLGEAKVSYGSTISDCADAFAEKAPKAANETNHYVINEWVNVESGAAVTTITADVSVKATYTAVEHTKDVYDITLDPTCTETGLADVSCSATECGYVFKNVVLDVIPDEAAPTGQFYVGNDKWTLEDFKDIDYTDVKFVNPNTYLVLNAWDLGSRSKNNPDAILNRGIGKIDYYVSDAKVEDPSQIGSWTNVYNFEAVKAQVLENVLTEKGKTMQDYIAMSTPGNKDKKAIDDEVRAILATYNANATGVLSNLNLVNGEEYIIYIRISDREVGGQSNKAYLSSGTISYGTEAPEITVSGEGYGTKFCDKVDVRITDDGNGLEILLDGEAVAAYTNPGTTSANGTFVATFETDEPGVHTVTVVDKHGNKSTKIFEIKGAHTYRNYTTAATCENDGAKYDVCTVCGAKANEAVIPAIGHNYINFIDKAPDCIYDGYRTYVCDNNCGTKLVLEPTDDAAILAQAKVAVDPEAEEIEWRALTADDLKHLKATGVHTYEKVKNKDGSDSEEDAWVIDKAATCKAEGSKHKDCTKCGYRVIEDIPVDTVNGHKFYREKVTLEPTCTEKGEKTKTCRYCGEVVKTAEIDALGHTAGDEPEYEVLSEASCEDTGSKRIKCAVCGELIGDLIEIPALGHAYKIDGEVYSEEETDEETGETITVYYQNYKCSRCGDIEKKKLDGYVPPVEATVSFVNGKPEEEAEDNTQEIVKFVGESIAADAVTVPTKEADAKCTYTFSHWADAEGKKVKFPIEVKGDAIYYAVYAERYINYTITYYAEDGITEIGKTGYLHNGDVVTLAKGPSKADTTLNAYEFNGWVLTTDLSDEPQAYAETYTINGANVNFKATYTEKDRYYAVTYAYDTDNILETFLVKAGTAARPCFETPTKAYDDVAHYVFAGWDKATQLAYVESNIYATPEFDAVAHSYVKDESSYKAATCTTPATYNYVCGCGHSEIRSEGKALGHDWSTPYENADGKLVVKCQREDCGIESTEGVSTHSITYYNAIGKVYTHSYNVLHNTELKDVTPSAPEKAADKINTYTFKGWSTEEAPVSGADDRTVLAETYKVTTDLELYPVFTATVRTYTVVYAYNAGNIIGEENVTAGEAADKTFENIEKAPDTKYHYTFNKWNKATELEAVYSDIYTTPDFTHEAHDFEITVKTGATCTADRVDTYACDCGYSYPRTIPGTALGHEWGEAVNGVKKCTRCDATSSESVTYSIVYYNAKGNVYTRAYNIVPGTLLNSILPSGKPAKAADKEYTYTFKGWATKADDGTLTLVADNATVDANLNLYPLYDAAKRTYTVKFLNAIGDVIYETTVEAGEAATCTIIPTKAHDTKYHYTFNNKWDKSEELKAVYSDIVTSAEFTPVEHTISGSVTTEATCKQKEIKTYTCSGCDYSYSVEGKFGDHTWGEPVNGVKTCTLCGATEEVGGVVEYTVKYYANETATTAISTKTVKAGTKLADISVITPSKDKDDVNTYAFSHWVYKGTETEVADDAVVESNVELVAVFTATVRKYTVIFAYDAKRPIVSYADKAFAEINTNLYNGSTPTKQYDNNNHYTFSGWKLQNKDLDNSAYIYYAQFTGTAHTMKIDSNATVDATCTEGASILEKCQYCDYTINYEQGSPLGHKLAEKENTRVPATPAKNGSVIFECTRVNCDYEEERELVWSDSGSDEGDSGNTEQSKNATIKVTVTDGRNAVQNAKVDIYSGGTYITTKYTNAQGVTTFEVAKGKYNVVITVTNANKVEITKDVQADCEIVGTVSIRGCGCACHRDNIWGSIFRFFHKIIKMLTGEFKCCSDPSHLYG